MLASRVQWFGFHAHKKMMHGWIIDLFIFIPSSTSMFVSHCVPRVQQDTVNQIRNLGLVLGVLSVTSEMEPRRVEWKTLGQDLFNSGRQAYCDGKLKHPSPTAQAKLTQQLAW